jgi:hypothetical protein
VQEGDYAMPPSPPWMPSGTRPNPKRAADTAAHSPRPAKKRKAPAPQRAPTVDMGDIAAEVCLLSAVVWVFHTQPNSFFLFFFPFFFSFFLFFLCVCV